MAHIEQAVVIGGSIAGLLAARVLSDHSAHVTVIERDCLPVEAGYRSGTPQARHGHGLLARGFQLLEGYFPDFSAELDARGIPSTEWMRETVQLIPGGWTPRYSSGVISRPMGRATLEAIVRARVRALPNVEFIEGMSVDGLVADADKRRITGVRYTPRHRSENMGEQVLAADLVVDASGRSSRAPEWLTALGYPAPAETVIDAHLGYATRSYRLAAAPDFKGVFMLLSRQHPRGGVFYGVEDEQWILTLAGISVEAPPTDEAGFNDFVARLPLPPLHEALRGATPISPIYGYARTANRLRHYERARLPDGFIALGDSVCAFNPVYGQGMTVSALAAERLDRELSHAGDDLRGFPHRFQRALARTNADAWLMATTEDLRFPTTEGGKATRLDRMRQGYLDLLMRAAPHSPVIAQALLETLHLLRRPLGLARPDVLWSLLRAALRGGSAKTTSPGSA